MDDPESIRTKSLTNSDRFKLVSGDHKNHHNADDLFERSEQAEEDRKANVRVFFKQFYFSMKINLIFFVSVQTVRLAMYTF